MRLDPLAPQARGHAAGAVETGWRALAWEWSAPCRQHGGGGRLPTLPGGAGRRRSRTSPPWPPMCPGTTAQSRGRSAGGGQQRAGSIVSAHPAHADDFGSRTHTISVFMWTWQRRGYRRPPWPSASPGTATEIQPTTQSSPSSAGSTSSCSRFLVVLVPHARSATCVALPRIGTCRSRGWARGRQAVHMLLGADRLGVPERSTCKRHLGVRDRRLQIEGKIGGSFPGHRRRRRRRGARGREGGSGGGGGGGGGKAVTCRSATISWKVGRRCGSNSRHRCATCDTAVGSGGKTRRLPSLATLTATCRGSE
jgi:hypothetical protein